MEGVWSDSKTFKLIELFKQCIVYTMYSRTRPRTRSMESIESIEYRPSRVDRKIMD